MHVGRGARPTAPKGGSASQEKFALQTILQFKIELTLVLLPSFP